MELPNTKDIRRAAERIAPHAVRTPLLSNQALDERLGAHVFLKCETFQRTGSFKFRGAYNALAAMDDDIRRRGVVAVSSGNHAQGVAEAARLFGVPAAIVMPLDAPAIKRSGTARRGAKVVDYDRSREDREVLARKLLHEGGGSFVHPYDDANVIAGQGTIGLEILADMDALGERPDLVLVPCSGGGLSAGIALALRESGSDAEILVVEPELFDDYARSLKEGRRIGNSIHSGSIADGLLASSPGAIGFALNQRNLSGALSVSDEQILAAVAFAFREMKLVVEPSGAAGLAAALAGKIDCRDRVVVMVLSGGNIDPAMLDRALAIS